MTEQIVDIIEANMPVSSDVEAAAKGAGAAAGEYAGRQAANESLADVRTLATTNKNRLDTLIAAPGTDNSELVDIRVGGDSKTYATAGDAVRGQYAKSVHGDVYVNATASNPAQAPYDDADTLPLQSVVTYEGVVGVQHLPEGWSHCTIITTSTGNQTNYGRTQIAVMRGGQIATRCKWVGSNPWSAWNVLALGTNTVKADGFVYGNTAAAPYNDANTIPVNTIVSIVSSNYVANMPPKAVNGTLVTLKNKNSSDGRMQLFITKDSLSWRLWWHGGQPQAWHTITDTGLVKADNLVYGDTASAPYNDANTLPDNSIVSIVGGSYVANMPPKAKDGTLVTLRNRDSNDGRMQLFVTADSLSWRLWWRGGQPQPWHTITDANMYDPQTAWSTLSIFPRIGVIGDSYASGAIYVDGSCNDHYPLSWGQIIARRNGVTCTNYSCGGLWTRSWLTNQYGLSKLNASDPDNLYLLALGINDVGNGGADYLGEPDDMTDDPANNPDTFYGNYARIIDHVRQHAPDAKLIIMTMASDSGVNASYNQAIHTIAEHHAIPCITQRDDTFFTSGFYGSMVWGHPVAATYGGMALAIERLFSKCVIDNFNYFKDYIG